MEDIAHFHFCSNNGRPFLADITARLRQKHSCFIDKKMAFISTVTMRSVIEILLIAYHVQTCIGETLTIGYITGGRRKSNVGPSDPAFAYDRPGQAISGAISLAVNEINKDSDILPNDRLEFVVAETYGDQAESLRQTALLWTQNVSVIIGPQETCICEAKLAGSLRIPMISYVSTVFKYRLCYC